MKLEGFGIMVDDMAVMSTHIGIRSERKSCRSRLLYWIEKQGG